VDYLNATVRNAAVSRSIDLIIINRPLLTNFSLLRAQFLACIRSIRLFLFLILRSSASRAFYALFASFSACLAVFSRASSSRAAVRSAAFLAFFFCCLLCLFFSCNRLLQFFICRRTLSLTFCLFQRDCTSHARVTFAALKNRA
jgi:hypothetical protein